MFGRCGREALTLPKGTRCRLALQKPRPPDGPAAPTQPVTYGPGHLRAPPSPPAGPAAAPGPGAALALPSPRCTPKPPPGPGSEGSGQRGPTRGSGWGGVGWRGAGAGGGSPKGNAGGQDPDPRRGGHRPPPPRCTCSSRPAGGGAPVPEREGLDEGRWLLSARASAPRAKGRLLRMCGWPAPEWARTAVHARPRPAHACSRLAVG